MSSQFSFLKIFLLLVLIGLLGFVAYAFSSRTSLVTQTLSEPAAIAIPAMAIVNQSNENQTVVLTKNDRFAVEFGNSLAWSISFNPSNVVQKISDASNIQGIFEAGQSGTFVLQATGRPICKQGEACPMFLQTVTINFLVK
jgi:hypothetical protein